MCVFSQRKVDFGILSVGHTSEKSITIKNEGNSTAVFHVDSVIDGVSFHPVRGAIPVGATSDVLVMVILDQPLVLDTVINVSVRGGRAIRLPIAAQAVVPNIEIDEPEFLFGQLTLGASSTLPLTLRNSSAVEGTLYINLQSYPEFTLAAAESLDAGDVGVYFESLT